MEKLTEKEIKDLSIQRYGNDQHSWACQRDGFEVGFKSCQEMYCNEWIDINDERYPKIGVAVMVHLKSGYISVGYRKETENGVCWQIFGDIIEQPNYDSITHWMPLPKSPLNK